MMTLLASIPSPSSGAIHLGPLQLRAYGLMIALGIVAAVWLAGRRLEQRHLGTRDDLGSIALWAVIAGVIGARLYHVVTDFGRFQHNLAGIPKIWQGGLGIPGGLILGVPIGIYQARKRGIGARDIATVAAPAIPLAQAIGRFGNWWNQELFGRATTLPWALRIDDGHLPAGYASGTTFHPTFLYEALGNFAICGVLLLIDRKRSPRPGRLMAWYLLAYSILRFWVEGLRIDPAHEIAGIRVNTWMSILVFVGAGAWLLWERTHHAPEPAVTVEGGPVEPAEPADDAVVEPDPAELGDSGD